MGILVISPSSLFRSNQSTASFLINKLFSRGGVEDIKLKAKDTKKIRGQGQECLRLRPRTQAQVFCKKKRCSKKIFRRSPKEENKNGLRKVSARFLAFSNKILTIQERVLSSSGERGSFRGLEASRPRSRTSKCVVQAKDVLEDFTSVIQLQFFKTTFCSLL